MAIEKCDRALLPISFRDFPRGSCGDAVLLLGTYLIKQGHGEFKYMLGQIDAQSHAWLERDGLIVDITADQFPDMSESVIVTIGSPWHERFNGEAAHAADYRIYDEATVARLAHAYEQIMRNI